ncbi:MAG: glutamine-hydrolyzing GMP synthase [Nitrospina sp.]|nr:glutamine-hydrolyzing GMP synthase [Nitrospina sp.]MBT3857842.1 glutamine-hydrolyzing GMP synthase [Nitrospina sp.]MBT4105506.1 glutamine-hydrolyzing GMP synthase [Nitrospina sp.]MBT4390924.1 glutamine-hydrolyzing GMP synthase [Nitrospina sp.]MBT4620133.1 glutamine-hydrolyzing GMP synthase [Nitrospina sp.]
MTTDTLHEQKILILDFGSQYTQNIARKVRESQVYCEIHPCTLSFDKIKAFNAKGIILSGGPASVLEEDALLCDRELFGLKIPILGICYGMQLITHILGGKVDPSTHREFGRAELMLKEFSHLFEEVNNNSTVWMSHGDRISKLPNGFKGIAFTGNSPLAAIENPVAQIYGLQFHPEVVHTTDGTKILNNFLFKICQCARNWKMDSLVEHMIQDIRNKVGDSKVVCGLSGGVDSSVAAVLIHKAIGDNLYCLFIDNGLLRSGEKDKVESTFRDNFSINLDVIDASDKFLGKLKGITDPEQKRKSIGNTFIEVFEEESKRLGDFTFLAQGTLYPDVIESVSFKGGPSAVIKSHHNVGGLPEKMRLKLLEPFRELFKDEVRVLGREMGMPDEIINRQPFPGPGLAIRILGEVTPERLEILCAADKIILQEIKTAGLYNSLWQSFAVLLPIKTVGVMGDARTYEDVIAIRAVTSTDGMTADWAHLPYELLGKFSNRIINEVHGVNRVVYDISSKPPGTIEWE